MAQLTAQGRVKLLFNGEGVSFGLEAKDPFQHKLRSVKPNKRRLRLSSSTRLFLSSLHKHTHFSAQARSSVGEVDDDDDEDDDDEFSRDDLACFRGLVLDISYRHGESFSWETLTNICKQFCLTWVQNLELFQAVVLEYYDQTVNSPSGSFYIPAVLRVPHLLQVVKRRRIKSNLSRKNILYRDGYTCQYCLARENLTIDHVLPVARGGEWKWENLVTACSKCNSKKGQKTLDEANMKLIKIPKVPKDYDILAIPLTSEAIRMLKLRQGTPEEWRQYLAES